MNATPAVPAVPNPSIMTKFAPAILAKTEPSEPAVEPTIIKALALRRGMVVRAWLHGEARGSEYTIKSAKRDGGVVHVEFEQPCQRPDSDYKAAYRFLVVKDVPVPSQPRRARRKPPEHLTHQPFAGLDEVLA